MELNSFSAGSEKKFSEFISQLDEEKLALISHTDVDGLISAKIVNEVLNADLVKFVNYGDLNDSLVAELKRGKFKKIVFTDLNVVDDYFMKALEHFAEILIIDHHLITKDWNSDKTTFINVQGHCAAYICYYLFYKIQDIAKMDWLAAVASVSDWAYFQNQDFMREIYKKYGDEFILEDKSIRKSGKFWDLQWNLNLGLIYFKSDLKKVYRSIGMAFGDIGGLEKYTSKVQEELDNLVEDFDNKKEAINEGYFYLYESEFDLGSIVINVISGNNYDKTIVTAYLESADKYKISIRRQDGQINVADYLKKILESFPESLCGGHPKAAGGSIRKQDLERFKEELRK